jgi:hypothetical protein
MSARKGSLYELAYDIGHAVLLTDVKYRNDVGMIEGAGRARFLFEACAWREVAADRRQQRLEGHVPGQARVAGAIDLAHPARTKERENFVRTQWCARLSGHPVKYYP